MPKYKYTAIDLKNQKFRAEIDAKDESDLRKILRVQGLTPINYKEIEDKYNNYKLKPREIGEFSRQMASMLGSGITVVRALEILMNRDFKHGLLSVYNKLHKDVQQGYTLSEGMRMQPRAFPELLINMFASGEASGQLEHVAYKMAEHYEKEHKLNGKIQAAMMYPIILLVVTFLVVLIIFTFVLPQFFDLFQDIELPFITSVVIAISELLQSYWYWILIGILILIMFAQFLLRLKEVALAKDRFKLKLPVIGKLLKIIYTARFSRTLSSLYSSGVSMITALEITSTIIGNKYIESQFIDVVKNIRNGEMLSKAIGDVKGFDSKLSASILIGEEAGRLDSLLESTAESFDYEAEVATGRLVQLLEPVMIVTMAVVVGIIVLSVMLPVISIYENAGNL